MNEKSKSALTFAGAAIYVDDVQAVLDFYRRAFGFETRFYDASLEFAELDTGATVLAIASHKTGETLMPGRYRRANANEPGAVEIAFLTEDVPAAFERAVSAGAIPVTEPRLMPWGLTVAYLRSIEGTLIGLSNPPKPKPAE
jgi:predicted enzyme related to lactoylglutathione lyase